VGGIDKRIEDLERLVGPPKDEAAERRRSIAREILDEFARLKSSRAVHYRAGVRVEPEDLPGKILGPDYTTEQLWELAARRVSEQEERRGA
jgi:hypothetical protein